VGPQSERDRQLEAEVRAKLAEQEDLVGIDVRVEDGVARLQGQALTSLVRTDAEARARTVPGLRDVDNRIESVWDLGRIFSNPFKERTIALFGGQVSLDDIEHDFLRKRFRDPRVHYAVNCASVSCPMLREEAYAAERLERQLDEQAERFLSDRSRNRTAAGRLEVSKIFEWYREDFEPLPAYLGRYARFLSGDAAEQVRITQGTLPIVFLEYDWSLNDARK